MQVFDWRAANRQAGRGWRLPKHDELLSLVSSACSPSINPEVFPGLDPIKLWYWSSEQTDKDLAWLVQCGGGATFNGYQTSQNAVRLVRSGK